MADRDGLIREWVSMFGPLPHEWGHHLPLPRPGAADLDAFSLLDCLHECYFDVNSPPALQRHIGRCWRLVAINNVISTRRSSAYFTDTGTPLV